MYEAHRNRKVLSKVVEYNDKWIKPAPIQQDVLKDVFNLMDRYAEDVMGGCMLRAKEWFEQQSKNK